ncbi:MAG: SdpI family protein [Oscillospiraceae bacterium]
MNLNRKLLIDILFVVMFFYYGYKYRYLTPSFKTKKGGLMTPRAKYNPNNWKMGHEFAGIVCFIFAGILAVIFAVKIFYIGYGTWFDWLHIGIELALVVALPFLIEAKLKKDGSNDKVEEPEDIAPGTKGLRDYKREQKAKNNPGGKKKKKK